MFVTWGDVSSFELFWGLLGLVGLVGGLDMGGGGDGGVGGGKKRGAKGDLGGFDSSWCNF